MSSRILCKFLLPIIPPPPVFQVIAETFIDGSRAREHICFRSTDIEYAYKPESDFIVRILT